jgi:hypothetical protein
MWSEDGKDPGNDAWCLSISPHAAFSADQPVTFGASTPTLDSHLDALVLGLVDGDKSTMSAAVVRRLALNSPRHTVISRRAVVRAQLAQWRSHSTYNHFVGSSMSSRSFAIRLA